MRLSYSVFLVNIILCPRRSFPFICKLEGWGNFNSLANAQGLKVIML